MYLDNGTFGYQNAKTAFLMTEHTNTSITERSVIKVLYIFCLFGYQIYLDYRHSVIEVLL